MLWAAGAVAATLSAFEGTLFAGHRLARRCQLWRRCARAGSATHGASHRQLAAPGSPAQPAAPCQPAAARRRGGGSRLSCARNFNRIPINHIAVITFVFTTPTTLALTPTCPNVGTLRLSVTRHTETSSSSAIVMSSGRKRDADAADAAHDRPQKRATAEAAVRSCANDGKPRICLGATGSVAAVKVPELVELLVDAGAYVDLVLSRAAAFFQGVTYRGETPAARLARLEASTDAEGTPRLCVWRDEDEWSDYSDVGSSSVLHIDLAKRNQLLLIAPLCANALASLALGLCGSLLTSVSRAWYYDMDEEFAAGLSEKYGRHVVSRPLYVHQVPSLSSPAHAGPAPASVTRPPGSVAISLGAACVHVNSGLLHLR
jgi:phosphopantothenoylcysteine decarboxylase